MTWPWSKPHYTPLPEPDTIHSAAETLLGKSLTPDERNAAVAAAQLATLPASQPAAQEPDMSLLQTIGADIKKVFAWIGSPKTQSVIAAGEGIIESVYPMAQGAINLVNTWMTEIIKSEALAAAAGAQDGSGAQKSASVIATLTPEIIAFAQAQKMPIPNAATIQSANDKLVAFLNVFQAAPVAPVATVAPKST